MAYMLQKISKPRIQPHIASGGTYHDIPARVASKRKRMNGRNWENGRYRLPTV
jgi:hypothetical protein